MAKVNEKINTLSLMEIAELEQNCTTIILLGGTKTCSTHSLEKFVDKLQLTPKAILKWFTKTRKKFLQKFRKRG